MARHASHHKARHRKACSHELGVQWRRSRLSSKISYNNMFRAYIKTFLRMELTPISLRAESGQIGGDLSHEFQILAKTGESTLYYDEELETLDPNNKFC